MYLDQTVFLIAGVSKSGSAATDFLLSKGAKCFVIDEGKGSNVTEALKKLSEKGAVIASSANLEDVIKKIDVLVLSPGIPIDNAIPIMAKKAGKRIIGELELGYLYSNSPIVAVTGTNGKTTTCSIISEILQKANVKSLLVGNIGVPFTSKMSETDSSTVAVTEVSSFQLETLTAFTPHIAVITNITEDHLSRHYNMQNYIYLKSKILFNLKESEYAVLNYDDYIVRGFADKTKGKVVYFSLKERVDGAYIEDGLICYKGRSIADVSLITIQGEHNLYNILASVAAAKLLNVPDEIIAEAVIEFKGIKHRIEFVRTLNGVDFFNDSKATNADSTVKAIRSMQKPTVLILGGRDKGQSFDALMEECRTLGVKKLILYGESRYKMLKSAERTEFENYCVATNLYSAVHLAYREAAEGDAVLLSPACASYDEFSGYEERGKKFIEIVSGIV